MTAAEAIRNDDVNNGIMPQLKSLHASVQLNVIITAVKIESNVKNNTY